MIPILYENTETEFTSEGLGRLAECTRCVVTEGVNDIFECEFDYPVTGKLFDEIKVGRIIYATHDDTREPQPFDIYRKSEPIGGVVTYNARHISYRLNEVAVAPFTAASCAVALQGLKTNSVGTNPFTFSTDKNVTSPYEVKTPSSLRGLLGGQENSILDVYGKGEYKFDKWSVQLLTNRGTAKSTSIRYGKNLIDYTNEYDAGDTYNAVYPYWFGSVSEGDGEPQDTLVELPEKYITSGQGVPSGRTVIVPMDLSQDFQEPPTVEELRTLATTRLANSDAWIPAQIITIDFVALWQTEEYKDFEPVQHVNLCDTISVVMPMYGTSYRTKVIKTEYNTLLDRYDKLELGTKPDNLAGVITASLGRDFNSIQQDVQAAAAAVAVTLKGDTLHYLATDQSSGVTTSTAGWTTTIQTITAQKPYLWTYHTYTRTDGYTFNSAPVIIGTFGKDGTSVTILGSYNTLAELQAAHPTGSLGDAYMVSGDLYVWNGSAWENVGQIQGPAGPQGPQGETGATGATGPQGAQGVSITKVQPQYYLSTSSTSATGGAWSDNMTYTAGKYIWTREKITFSNGTTGYSTAVYNDAITTACAQSLAANNIAANTQQHFWFTETGQDTGAHITEVTQDEFLADPTQGGGNLLARSNGVAIRKGLTEVATFAQDGVTFSDDVESTAQFGSDSARIGKASGSHISFGADAPFEDGASMRFSRGSSGLIFVAAAEINSTQAQAEFDGLPASKWGGGGLRIHSDIAENETEVKLYSQAPNVTDITSLWLYSDRRIESDRDCKVLWSGSGYLMTADHTVNLNGTVGFQLSGIVLVWSRYSNQTVYNDSWAYQFVPKWHTLAHNDNGVYFSMPLSNTSATVCNKYLYINEDGIRGHASNNATGTGYNNAARVLRAVLGV